MSRVVESFIHKEFNPGGTFIGNPRWMNIDNTGIFVEDFNETKVPRNHYLMDLMNYYRSSGFECTPTDKDIAPFLRDTDDRYTAMFEAIVGEKLQISETTTTDDKIKQMVEDEFEKDAPQLSSTTELSSPNLEN